MPPNPIVLFSYSIGKLVYTPETLVLQDATGATLLDEPLLALEVRGGDYKKGGLIITSSSSQKSIQIHMRPYGTLMFYNPFSELKKEKAFLGRIQNPQAKILF